MTRLAAFLLISLGALAIFTLGVSAQTAQKAAPPGSPALPQGGRSPEADPGPRFPPPRAEEIEGKLVFVDSLPAIRARGELLLIVMPGFAYLMSAGKVRDGAAVTLGGYALPPRTSRDRPRFLVAKAVIDGATFDFPDLLRHDGQVR